MIVGRTMTYKLTNEDLQDMVNNPMECNAMVVQDALMELQTLRKKYEVVSDKLRSVLTWDGIQPHAKVGIVNALLLAEEMEDGA
jgi:hypothetical protein